MFRSLSWCKTVCDIVIEVIFFAKLKKIANIIVVIEEAADILSRSLGSVTAFTSFAVMVITDVVLVYLRLIGMLRVRMSKQPVTNI